MLHPFLPRPLPEGLEALTELALDLFWTWSHGSDRLWQTLDPQTWERTENPWLILQRVSGERLAQVAADDAFKAQLQQLWQSRQEYLNSPGWYGQTCCGEKLKRVAYFSMEFGLSEALPLYAGGLGILAGDYLKTASDLNAPLVGLGLLYQEGYFRQILDANRWQIEAFPYNDPISMPISPARDASGGWLRIALELPGRVLSLRIWVARVGKVQLYLLDSNDPLNSPADRGITSKLYDSGKEMRLLQEMVLGIGGWRVLEALGLIVEVCHLNEGHAAFAVLERARSFTRDTHKPFAEALWATRAGNVFTTHTPVAAALDTYEAALINKYFRGYVQELGISLEQLLALGRNGGEANEAFNMAYLALHGCGRVNGVSRLHGEVSRRLFHHLFLDWPEQEVPVGHITNGVHVPSWDSAWADMLWTGSCGKERWLGTLEGLGDQVCGVSDENLWNFRASGRQHLVNYTRQRLARQMGEHDASPVSIERARHMLDPNALTLGFARRFTAYKRPNLLLHDEARMARLLCNAERPVQLIVAGKAHPSDNEGKQMIQALAHFARRTDVCDRIVFLEDYDIDLAQHLVLGVDLWINTPRRPWEACGTSGMKVLVNGGLNISELDGWWAEAYAPEVGWALGDGREHGGDPGWDATEADQFYQLLEQQVVPAFYERDPQGLPRAWIARVRASMATLTPRFSSNRMLREYVETVYLPAAEAYSRRSAQNGALAAELLDWHRTLEQTWGSMHFGTMRTEQVKERSHLEIQVYLGDMNPAYVNVELYCETADSKPVQRIALTRADAISGAINGYLYRGELPDGFTRVTPRIIPFHPDAQVPLEDAHILWQR